MSKNNTISVVDRITKQQQKSVLRLSHKQAQKYFLKPESYCNFDLPEYFDFMPLLSKVHKKLNGEKLSIFKQDNPRNYDDINYTILDNKDGRYAWRPRQLIHPVLYVSLIHQITDEKHWETIRDRFKYFAEDKKIECASIPSKSLTKNSDKAAQVSNWWEQIEQRSLELALDYKYLTHTDITDCYGSIYTHSVAWAIHDKDFMKKNKNDKLLIGNIIDKHLQDMSQGQTNGIPQGSALMNFIAEMVLGYADSLLLKKIPKNIKNYKILRYRDDYRIFTNNPRDGEHILKNLTEVMIGLGLKLSAGKTKSSSDVITSSIKDDKLYWIGKKQTESSPQKRLLIIHELATQHPNSGSLALALNKFGSWVRTIKNFRESIVSLVSIVVDIAYNNPKTYPNFTAIVSSLLKHIPHKKQKQKQKILKQIFDKFKDIPNTGYLLIWLQRIAIGAGVKMDFDEKLCQLIPNRNYDLWNNSWLKEDMKNQIKADYIINQECIENLPEEIPKKVVDLYKSNYDGSY